MNKISQYLILLPLALTSCGIYGSFDKENTVVRDDAYGRGYVETSDTLGIASYAWRDIFTDPALRALIEEALANNADLRTAQLQCDQAFATLKAARLAYFPSFGIGANGSVNGSMEGGSEFGWDIPLTASWQIDLFGSLRNANKKAAAQLMQTEAMKDAVQAQVIAATASAYYSLVALDTQYEIYCETEKNWKESVETTRHLMEAGKYSAAAVAQAEANYYGVCISLVDIRKSISELENTLCSLTGRPAGSISRGRLSDWKEPENISAGIPMYALAGRPDIRQAASTFEASYYNTNQARSAMFPSLTITGAANFGSLLYSAAASLLEPIFQNGKLTAQLNIAKAQQEQAAIAFSQSVIDAGIEVNNIMTTIASAREKSEFYTLQKEALASSLRSTTLLMQQRSGTYLEILTAQSTLLNAQISEVSNILEQITGVISLYQALGGGAVESLQ